MFIALFLATIIGCATKEQAQPPGQQPATPAGPTPTTEIDAGVTDIDTLEKDIGTDELDQIDEDLGKLDW